MMRPLLLAMAIVASMVACLARSECTSDSDCAGDDVCSSGVCVRCEDDGDCAAGEACSDNDCVEQQIDPPSDPGGDGCGSDADCGTGFTCQTGQCVASETETCCVGTTALACSPGGCPAAIDRCTAQCQDDAACLDACALGADTGCNANAGGCP